MREYMEMYKYEQYRGTHEFTKEKLGRHTGAWKDGALDGRLEIHATAALLWAVTGDIHSLQAPWPGHEDPGESVKLPRRVVQMPSDEQGVSTCIAVKLNRAKDEQTWL